MDYLCIGHFCKDVTSHGYILGSPTAYSSLIAHHLGKKVGMLTSFGKDFLFLSYFADLVVQNKEAPSTTIFENIYAHGQRTQYIHSRATDILVEDLPATWENVPLVHLTPIADEVDFGFINVFSSDTIVAASLQGWLRQWDKKSRIVSPKIINWQQLKGIDILILSEEDIYGHEGSFSKIRSQVPLVVLTKGAQPATVFYQNNQQDYPVFPTNVVDPTGAGDAFATGFLVKYIDSKNIAEAMAYGHSVASICIESEGLDGIRTLSQVTKRFGDYRNNIMPKNLG